MKLQTSGLLFQPQRCKKPNTLKLYLLYKVHFTCFVLLPLAKSSFIRVSCNKTVWWLDKSLNETVTGTIHDAWSWGTWEIT